MVLPVICKPITAPMSARGIENDAISVILQLPKNKRIMMETNKAPITASSTNELSADRTTTV